MQHYQKLIESAADALINWEMATDFAAVARFYHLAYDFTCKAITLQVKDKETVFRDISRTVLAKRNLLN